jgi:hypothetical protein
MESVDRVRSSSLEQVNGQDTVPVRIVTEHGVMIKSALSLAPSEDSLMVYWRSEPDKVGCDVSFIKDVSGSRIRGRDVCMIMKFADMVLRFEFEDELICKNVIEALRATIAEVAAVERKTQVG